MDFIVKKYVEQNLEVSLNDEKYNDKVKTFIIDSINDRNISLSTMFLIMYEQDLITLTEKEKIN